MIKAGLIGYGYWGPNILRNFDANPDIEILKVCDLSNERLAAASDVCPKIDTTTNPDEIYKDKNIDLVAVVTPVFTHFEIAKNALLNGKHVFVEKPFTSTSDQAKELIDVAGKKNLTIMVDHTFLFTSAVNKMKEIVDEGTLGDLYYYDSVRVNLGLLQHDINVIWDLAPHDISILNYLTKDLNMSPVAVNATGSGHFGRGLEDVGYLHVQYDNDFSANFHVNWLSPVKNRTTMVGGTKKMLIWDDLSSDEKIKVYDKGVDVETRESAYNLLVGYRAGDMWSPRISNAEALKEETKHLVECIKNSKTPINGGIEGLNVVKILEASNRSLKQNGKGIAL